MSIVKINAIEIPEGHGEELERRFVANSGSVQDFPGFIRFQLLRPTAGEKRYFVYTEWETEEAYVAWRESRGGQAHGRGEEGGKPRKPVATGASLLEFDVALDVVAE
ncbi:antibiotic biosynthesis monooxygenase family protein [Corynebacterium ulceribovis]|uniref:antibiotic biosynthesis monooxygenase family protein n=1 Tax=Corynebacterium ulceribovis TaxID=487732 RepID=UPI0003789F6E|nr:antibiotic biosynthesis monooxygenase [Corynebacterium ulceribovis]